MKRTNLSRRHFLGRAAAAVAAPMILPARVVFGDAHAPAPSNRVTLGHIGVGGQGTGLLKNFLGVEGSQSVAISDCFASRRERAVQTVNERYAERAGRDGWKGCDAHADFRELLARPDIDAVVVATPDHWHVPVGLYAVRAGKDTYIEKPLGVAMTWAWELRAEIKRRGAVFQYGTQQRSSQHFRFACELVRNGAIGTLQRIEAWCGCLGRDSRANDYLKGDPVPADLDYDRWLGPAPAAPYFPQRVTSAGAWHIYDYALGFIAGWGAHPLDIAQWGHDSDDTAPVEYEGTGYIPADGPFDTVATWDVNCRYADGIPMHFMDNFTARPIIEKYRKPHDHGTTFFGDKGWVSVDRGGAYASDPAWMRIKWKAGDVRLYESNNHYANFVECVRSRRPTVNPIDSAVNSDLISHLSNIAIRLGRRVKWNPAKESIVGDESAGRMLHRPLRAPWTI